MLVALEEKRQAEAAARDLQNTLLGLESEKKVLEGKLAAADLMQARCRGRRPRPSLGTLLPPVTCLRSAQRCSKCCPGSIRSKDWESRRLLRRHGRGLKSSLRC